MSEAAQTATEQLLVVEDDRATRANLRDILELDGYRVRTAGSIREAVSLENWSDSAAVILDRRLPEGLAEDELPNLAAAAPEATFIIVTAHHDLAGAIACLKRGADDYILKPLNPDALRASIRRALEHRRARLALRLAEQRLRHADRLSSIGTLAAGLGHDMHNVLLPLRSRLDVMEADVLPARSREQLPAIRRAIAYLQELSDALHMLALDPSDDDASTQTTDIAEWWSQVGSLLGRTLPRRIAFKCAIAPNLPEVCVPPHRLTQAVLNLLVNAGEAIADEGEVRLSAEMNADSDHVRISVSDSGEGMTEEVQHRALDPFFTTKKRGLGTGLGLSLVHGLVQQAGGAIEIESKVGKGTKVALVLPARPAASSGAGDRPLATVSIDDARVAGFIGSFLTSAGFDVAHADDGLPRDSALWIVDPAATRIHTAKRFLRISRKRRILVIGKASEEWRAIGAQVIEDESDVESLRRAIGEAIGDLTRAAD